MQEVHVKLKITYLSPWFEAVCRWRLSAQFRKRRSVSPPERVVFSSASMAPKKHRLSLPRAVFGVPRFERLPARTTTSNPVSAFVPCRDLVSALFHGVNLSKDRAC